METPRDMPPERETDASYFPQYDCLNATVFAISRLKEIALRLQILDLWVVDADKDSIHP